MERIVNNNSYVAVVTKSSHVPELQIAQGPKSNSAKHEFLKSVVVC